MKALKNSCLILIVTLFVSCSSDDNNTQKPKSSHVITLNNETYVVNTVIVEPAAGDNTFISLINKTESEFLDAINNGTQLNNVNVFNMRINQSPLGEQAYGFSDIPNFEFFENAQIINGELEDGNILLDNNNADTNLNASTGSFTLDLYANDQIEFSFQFTRNDGTEISGTYNGSFLYLASDE
jgi:hypothetical protein